jgi:hypothetical protein
MPNSKMLKMKGITEINDEWWLRSESTNKWENTRPIKCKLKNVDWVSKT